MDIRDIALYRYRLPLREPVSLKTTRISHREGLVLQLTDAQGRCGWGEAAPLPGFSRETLADAQAALCAWIQDPAALSPEALPETFPPSAFFAVSGAWYSLQAAQQQTSVARLLSDSPAETIRINALLMGDADTVLARAQQRVADGYRAVKLKVGQGRPEDDAALVRRVKAAIGEGTALRLDANRAWNMDQACAFANALGACPIEYCEEPLLEPERLPELLAITGMPYALDESLAEGPGAYPETMYRDAAALIWKPTLLSALHPADLRARFGLPDTPVILSAAFESGVGTALLAQFAAAAGDAPAGLDPYTWLAQDFLSASLPLGAPSVALADCARFPDITSPHLTRLPV